MKIGQATYKTGRGQSCGILGRSNLSFIGLVKEVVVEKKYDLPDDVILLHTKYKACLKLRDKYASMRIGYRLARKSAIDAESYIKKFWHAIYEIYPKIRGKSLTYDWNTTYIRAVDSASPEERASEEASVYRF